jgi:hypothetical protein
VDEPFPFRRPVRWDRLRSPDAQAVVRERSASTRNVVFTRHADERALQRDIVRSDVYRILREGGVGKAPRRSGDGWEVHVEMRMPGGRSAAVVTVLVRDDSLVTVLTVMWLDEKS